MPRPALGRVPSRLDRRDYPLEAYLTAADLPPSKSWPNPTRVLDQKETPHCGGFSAAGFGNVEPICDRFTNRDGHKFYYVAKEFDGEPKQENGTCMRSVAKALQKAGRIPKYAFTSSLETIKRWVLLRGPLMVGTGWTEGMFTPDAAGIVHATGELAGGHAYVLIGYDGASDRFEFLNSWGKKWGKAGRFYMDAGEWFALFHDDGEAITAVESPIVPKGD